MTTIRWERSDVAKGYRIYRDTSPISLDSLPPSIAELDSGTLSYDIGDDDSHWYVVSAFIDDYEVFSDNFTTGLESHLHHDIFRDGSEVITLPLLESNPYLSFSSSINLSVGYQEEEGFSMPQTPIQDGSYSNRINVELGRSTISYSFWYKSYGLTGESFQYLLDQRLGNGTGYLTVNPTGFDNSSRAKTIKVDTEFTLDRAFDGKWRHVYVEFDNSTDEVTIGSRSTAPSYDPSTNGMFRLFRAFNRPLTEEEISILYKEGKIFNV